MPLTAEHFRIKSVEDVYHLRSPLERLKQVTSSYQGNAIIVDKLEDVRAAAIKLKRSSSLAVDCEGVQLGRGGKLTLVQIAARKDIIYLFDILSLGNQAFEGGLKEILESNTIAKYMYDCRGDADSLWHEYDIHLNNVLDMQLFEYIVRPIAGMNLRGPSRPSHHRSPIIRGLNAAVKTYVKPNSLRSIGISHFDSVKEKGADIMKAEKTIWRYRPLSEGLVKYAALDIETIWLVAEALQKIVPISGIVKERLEIASERYVSIRSDVEKPDDLYIRHAILPSYVIPNVIGHRIECFPVEDTKCNGCKRMLNRSCIRQNLCEDCTEVVRASRFR